MADDIIEATGKHHSNYVIFPELSLTGYELERSDQLAFSYEDERLIQIRSCCITNNINAVVGVPVRFGKDIMICSLIFFKDGTFELYTKHFLYPGEEQYFIPGNLDPKIIEKNEIFSFAICADTNNPIHRSKGLTPVCETGIKTPYLTKQPVADIQSVTGYLVSLEYELSYSNRCTLVPFVRRLQSSYK